MPPHISLDYEYRCPRCGGDEYGRTRTGYLCHSGTCTWHGPAVACFTVPRQPIPEDATEVIRDATEYARLLEINGWPNAAELIRKLVRLVQSPPARHTRTVPELGAVPLIPSGTPFPICKKCDSPLRQGWCCNCDPLGQVEPATLGTIHADGGHPEHVPGSVYESGKD